MTFILATLKTFDGANAYFDLCNKQKKPFLQLYLYFSCFCLVIVIVSQIVFPFQSDTGYGTIPMSFEKKDAKLLNI